MPSPTRLTLVCFPHAGGGLGRYRGWRDALPDGVEVVLPDLPGREARLFDDPLPDVASMSCRAIEDLAAVIARSERLAIAGLSYGALVAYDMAARLEASGKRVEAVFAASQRSPATPLPHINWRSLSGDRLIAELTEIGGLSPELGDDPEFLELFLPVIRAELHASESYVRPATHDRLRCPVFVYHGTRDGAIPASSAQAWRDETDHFSWRSLEAAHFLTGPDGADLWFEALKEDLTRCTAGAL
ncbi:thioesterase II family protein [Streptomyces sp. NPDC002104]